MVAKLTIQKIRALAKERGGTCLSITYVNAVTKLRWRCAKGHEWEAVPNSVKDQGTWCPTCSGNTRLTIAEMRAVARRRGGRCLSTAYVNARTKLQWKCRKGHEWQAIADSIKRGSWCPLCASVRARPERRLTIDQMQVLARSSTALVSQRNMSVVTRSFGGGARRAMNGTRVPAASREDSGVRRVRAPYC